jgi:hypothetical protein
MHLFYCLMQLLLECLDNLKVTHPRMIELRLIITEFFASCNKETINLIQFKNIH